MKDIVLNIIHLNYRYILKPILFLLNPETVHTSAIRLGEWLGRSKLAKKIISCLFSRTNPKLQQKLFGLKFNLPVGLAAGFDYEARLTQILPALGFGFGTVGTITNEPYAGNARPMLGRLPESMSLMVNKGFKNPGVATVLSATEKLNFQIPIGLSLGKTNTENIITQADAVSDIVKSFKAAEASSAPFTYYELNISCPNLKGSVEFYEPTHLQELLTAIQNLNIKKPVWVKMPISKTDTEIEAMLEIITGFPFVQAVVIGNLQRDRNHPTLKLREVNNFEKGNFSGLACKERSDELIALVYKKYGSKIKIVGCGGIFNAEDAYKKITLGASLVELITGMIYEGPQLITQINSELTECLVKDGFRNISEAVGSRNR